MDLVVKSHFEMIFLFVKNFVPNGYIIEISKWAFILMNFMSFVLRISPYQVTTTFFNMGFDLVLKGFLSEWNFSSQRLH